MINKEHPMSLKEVAKEITKNWEAREAIEELRDLINERFNQMDARLDKLEGDTEPIIRAREERETAFRYGKRVGTNVWNFGKWVGGIGIMIGGVYAAFKAGFVEAVHEAMKHSDKIPPTTPPGIGN